MDAVTLSRLRAVKLVHTVAWAFFASAVILIPVAATLGAWRATWILVGLVAVECVVLLVNGMRCPLTPIAGRYTADRAANFDIYLPLWLARWNKHLFGTLYVAGVAYALLLWFRHGGP